MHVLLVPFGSHGDVHPFLGLAHALRDRGHRVTFVISDHFGPLIRGLGYTSVPLGEAVDFESRLRDPDLWHPRRAFAVVARSVLEGARLVFERIEELHVPGETIAVGGTLAFGVRLAEERLGIPSATVHLQPAAIHSNFDAPRYAGLNTSGWPRWLKQRLFNVIFPRIVDPQIEPGLNAYRAELGLPPVRDVMRGWMHAPRLVLGFFPSWFGATQPDWPPNVRLVGFPLYDERDATPLPAGLDAFLDAGSPPIAFTPGSANIHGRPFFEAAVIACNRLGRRGLFLTRYPEQVPPGLPEGIRHIPFAPFGLLLPRVAALVHHGGVGTAAQGMAAGVPQLVMPLAHDQFDNAARLQRLGIARALVPKKFRGPKVAEALAALLDRPEAAQHCRAVATRFADDPAPMERASEAIEALFQGAPVPA
jgi:rhamnosyltransferase subunit B